MTCGEVQSPPILTSPGHVGGARRAVDYSTQVVPMGVHYPNSAGPAAVDIALNIHLHAIRVPRPFAI